MPQHLKSILKSSVSSKNPETLSPYKSSNLFSISFFFAYILYMQYNVCNKFINYISCLPFELFPMLLSPFTSFGLCQYNDFSLPLQCVPCEL